MKKLLLIIAFLLSAQSAQAALPKAPNNLGLVGYWSFNEGTGLKAGDASGSGNTGTLTNGPTWSGGKLGRALGFDGVDDYVTMPHSSRYEFGSSDFSITWWEKRVDVTENDAAIGRDDTVFSPFILGFGASPASVYMSSGSGWDIASGKSMGYGVNNVWSHLAITRSGTTFTTYRDGVAVTSWTSALALGSSSSPLMIGRTQGGTTDHQLRGSIDEVRIYNRALGANEITRLYNAGSSKLMGSTTEAGTGLIGHWKLDDRAGTRAIDSSGSGNNGTLTNFALAGATSNWLSGRLAGGLSFDGTNDYIAIPALTTTTTYTYSVWVKPNAQTANYGGLIAPAGGGQSIYYRGSDAGGNAGKITYWNSGSIFDSTIPLVDGQWNHIVGSVNAGALSFYINGSPAGTATGVPSMTAIRMGYDDFAWYFKGSLDDVRIYNRALSADEIKKLYTSGSSRPTTANTNSAALTAGTNLATGLVGHWTFDGKYLSTTTARDTSGQGKDGTITAAVPGRGMLGQGLEFNGSTSKVVAPSIDLNGEMTLSAWFKTNDVTTYAALISNNPSSGADYDYGLFLNYTLPGKLTFLWETGPYIRVTSAATIAANTWYHAVAVRSGSTGNWTAKMYINGALDNTATGITVNPSSVNQTTTIGAINAWSGSHFFSGSLDDVRIYNRALSAQEVQQLYRLGK